MKRAIRSSWAAILLAAFAAAEPLPGTAPLTTEGDLAAQMIEGADRFLLQRIADAKTERAARWQPDFSSRDGYAASLAPRRKRLAEILGAVDALDLNPKLEYISGPGRSELVGRGPGYKIYAVRWPVFRGIASEGLLFEPDKSPLADIIALGDADQTPEMLAGLAPGLPPTAQFARRLAESGCRVLAPALVNRDTTYAADAGGARPTNLTHREFLYRPAFELGRHIIGYEVAKVRAGVSCLQPDGRPIGVVGHGEGGLLALCAAALDERIAATLVSGYFDARDALWREPIYRNVFGLLEQFGDAELAAMIAPRALMIEACQGPEIAGPPAPKPQRQNVAAPGQLTTPKLDSVKSEFAHARDLVAKLSSPPVLELAVAGTGDGPAGSSAGLAKFVMTRAPQAALIEHGASPESIGDGAYRSDRQRRIFDQINDDTQLLLRNSEAARAGYWSKADRGSRDPKAWRESVRPYRERFYRDAIGRFELPLAAPNPRSRVIYDEPKWTGYEVVLDVFPDLFAYGILLLPKDLRPGEKRPVVVCQHGLEGRPQDVANPAVDHWAYHHFASRLADEGFIVYAPQNPYIGGDKFRTLQRKANPLGKTLFSLIIPQHQQTLRWLAALPNVDPERIAFYGLSYGGKTAMRVPAVLEDYCLSICSADFNEWVWKNASTASRYSYVGTNEYEIFEFDLGSTFNYAEMAGLIAPRPFMVERGHRDGVSNDSMVAYEYAKIRLLYADLNIPERTEIEFFDGPHTIHGVGTFDFLRRQLDWPRK